MATKKNKVSQRKTQPAAARRPTPRSTPAASRGAPAGEPSESHGVVARIQGRWPTLTEGEAHSLGELSTDPQRVALGLRTKAPGVAIDAVRWALAVDEQLRAHPGVARYYHPKRFAFFLLRLMALLDAVDAQATKLASKLAATDGSDAAALVAREHRGRLLMAMDRLAGRRPDLIVALASARLEGTTHETLADSMRRLAALATQWLRKSDPILLEVSGLSPELVEEVRTSATALMTAAAASREARAILGRDTPEVNLVEGWVLEEMLRLRDDFEQAHDADSQIPRLVPGKATRRVLARPRTRSARASRRVVAQAKAALAKGQPGRRMNGAASA